MGNSENRIDSLLEAAIEKIQAHDISGALGKLMELVELDSQNVQAINLIASCYYVLGEFERSEACWDNVLRIESANKIAILRLNSFRTPAFQFWLKRYNEALFDVENRNYKTAQNKLRELLEENDGFVSVYQMLGLCYMADKDEKKAIQVWRKGLELDTSNPILTSYLHKSEKTTLENQNQTKQKIVALPVEKSVSRRGNLVWVISGVLCLALCLQIGFSAKNMRTSNKMIEDMQVKIQFLSQIVNKDNTSLATNVVSGEDLHGVNNEEMSMAGSDYDTSREKYYYDTGYSAYVSKDWKTATSNLGMVVSMHTNSYLNREALYFLARTYYLTKNYSNAEKFYLEYLQKFPDSNYYDDSLYYLGCVYYYTGDKEKAIDMFQQLETFEPESGYISSELFKKVMN
ncbi:MAG: tetratricopeptide repeat protein [Syntrophomonadaceae bacterium]|nr:tetratricopeptide repeat protein [Syntrophomonadaceae bacterium]